jgi:predicted HTH domain antitoxin
MSIQINLPEGLKISPFELNMLLAAKLFDEGLINTGQGAEMVGLSKQAFIEMLGKYKVSIFQYDIDEIEEDLSNA